MTLDFIYKLQTYPDRIRNFTICAHIDHGKTSLTDSLLASNGLLNAAQAGQIRYLDYLALEQERCITIKSALISLVHVSYRQPKPFAALFHLFDSPGHCDFASEVLQAFSLSDSAVLLVDVVEGVSSQTQVIINQLKQLKLKIVLGVNKIDRLFLELKMTPEQAFTRILEVVAEVNQAFGKSKFSFEQNVFVSCSLHSWGFDSYRAAYVVKLLCKQAEDVDLDELRHLISQPNTVLTESGFKTGAGTSVMSLILQIVQIAYSGDAKMIKRYIKKTGLATTGKDEDLGQIFLRELFQLGAVVFDQILCNTGDRENQYIQELSKLPRLDSLLVCTKMLNPGDVDMSTRPRGFLTVCRVQRSFKNDVLEVDTPFYDYYGRYIVILNVYYPLGKTLLETRYNNFCKGCIIVIESDIFIRPGSILFQQFTEAPVEAADCLTHLDVRASATCKNNEVPAPEFIYQVSDELARIRERILRFYKPLITVCLNPELLSQYNRFADALEEYCERDLSCRFSVSDLGELMLAVCGDVHLDYCIDCIRKQVPDITFSISDSSFTICEVVAAEKSLVPLRKFDKMEERLLELEEQIFAVLNAEDMDFYRAFGFLRNLPQIQGRDAFLPHYFKRIGEILDPVAVNPAGLELSVIQAVSEAGIECVRYSLLACAFPAGVECGGAVLCENEADNARLLVDGEFPEALREVLRHAFRANARYGPICFERVQDVSIRVQMVKCESRSGDFACPRSLAALIKSEFPGYYFAVRYALSACYDDILHFVRAALQLSSLRIKEPHLRTLIQCPAEYSSAALQLAYQFYCQEIALIGYSASRASVSCMLPLRHALVFSRELRQSSSGRATADFSGIAGFVLPEDPRKDYAGDAEEEIEWGYQGRGNNLAAQVVLEIQRRKGLIVEDVVKDAEKQRTVKKSR